MLPKNGNPAGPGGEGRLLRRMRVVSSKVATAIPTKRGSSATSTIGLAILVRQVGDVLKCGHIRTPTIFYSLTKRVEINLASSSSS